MRKFIAICLGLSLFGLITPPLASAQSGRYTVQGTVVDATGLPVIGATVVEKGTANGVSTDFNGEYTLSVSNANSVVEVSYIGFKTVELIAASELLKKLTLEEDLMSLDEVVVIGYGSVKKNDMTGSVVAIKAEDVNRGAVNSPDQLLLGKVPGLLVTPATGEPGTGAKIRIRGAASLNANNDPLIVIDGVPVTGEGGAGMGNPLGSINPSDIETYTVLKDASATAIYGSRASNGVIIITTKKGKGKTVQVSYDSSYTVKTNANRIKVMSGTEFEEYMLGYADNLRAADDAVNADKIVELLGYNGVNYNTDWQKLIYRTAFATDHNLSVFGNNEAGNFPYRVSLGANYDQGTVKGGDNTRVNLGVNLSPKFLKEHLAVTVNVKGVWNRSNWTGNAVGDAITYDPTKPVYNYTEDGEIDYDHYNGYWNWEENGLANTQVGYNPMSSLYDFVNATKSLRSIGNLQLDYKIHGLEDLRLNLNLGYDITDSKTEKYAKIGSFDFARSERGKGSAYTNYKAYNANTLLDFYANYNKEFGKHHLDIMAGYSWQHNYDRSLELNWLNRDRSKWHPDSEDAMSRLPYPQEYYLISFFGRLNYSIDSKYLFTVTVREDATSRFSKNNRWGLFPSAAFAWNIAQEDFLADSESVSALKLRLGWGRTGQQDIEDLGYYPYIPTYDYKPSVGTSYLPGYGGTLAPKWFNRDIKWETTETYNAGLDFGFLNGRINGSVDYYYRRTYDLLSVVNVPTGTNYDSTLLSNIGSMKNQGVEVALNFIPIERKDMRWTISLNGTWQQTRITELNGDLIMTGANLRGTGGESGVHREGFEPNTFYLYQQAYDADGNPIQNTFIDRNGDGRISEDDRYITGKSATPDFFYGVAMQFTYKNWDFGFNGHGTVGNYAINKLAVDNNTAFVSSLSFSHLTNFNEYHFRNGFTQNSNLEQYYSDMFIENASFFRMDDINVGYTFRNIGKSDVNLRLAASVQNVFVITKFSGLDPENSAADGVYGTIIPRPRLYTLRLNINF